ncbi:MAG TPA: PDZ domain-containing protein [Pirellulales bacterium]
MQTDVWQRRIGWYALVAFILSSGVIAQSKWAKADEPRNPGASSPAWWQLIQDRQPAPQEGDKYWLGVECRDVPPELQSQLGLKEGEGLIVMQIVQDSPAAKAGLKQHDIILSAGETKLAHPPELIKAVNASNGKELSLKIIRAGKEQTLAASPAERPQLNLSVIARPNPGILLPRGAGQPLQLPKNVSVSVSRQGSQPAKILVSRGDEKWELNEHELDKLPEDLRPFVQGMLGGPATIAINTANPAHPNAVAQALKALAAAQGQNGQPNGAIQQLQQALQTMQAQQGMQGPQTFQLQAAPPGDPNGWQMNVPGQNIPLQNLPHLQFQSGPAPGDIMQRLDEIDRRLQQLQEEIRGGGGQPRAPGKQPMGWTPANVAPGGSGGGGRRGPPQDGNRPGPQNDGPHNPPPAEVGPPEGEAVPPAALQPTAPQPAIVPAEYVPSAPQIQ